MDDYGGGTCAGLYGYASVREWLGSGPTNMSDTITVTFASKKLKSLSILGKPLLNYTIRINDSISRNYLSPPRYSYNPYHYNQFELSSIGFTSAQLSNVTKISIKALDANWSFAINGIGLSQLDNGIIIPEPEPVPMVENPVIFVPGVAGSELKEADVRVRWLSKNILDMSNDLDALKLPSNRNIFATDILRGLTNQIYFTGGLSTTTYKGDFYEKLMTDLFLGDSGLDLTEYNVLEIPSRRTTAGCDMDQNTTNESIRPKLFVFAYDWRQDNNSTASALRDYVGCVKRFYPNKKVRIVTHSMGSLVARRYALRYPDDNHVDKIITIAAPWLGAPKGIYSLETGSFIASAFGYSATQCLSNTNIENRALCLGEWSLNNAFASNLREAMVTFPGPIQLLPSWYHYQLQQSDSGSGYLSVRRSIWGSGVDYDFQDATNWSNERHAIHSGDVARDFHMNTFNGLQDDWSRGTGNIKFYHIYGQQSSNISLRKVNYKYTVFCNAATNLNCVGREYFEPVPTNGDGTVSLHSSRRISSQYNYNSTNVKRYIEDAKNPPSGVTVSNSDTEHTLLTANPRVHKRISRILRNNDDDNSSGATALDGNDPIPQNIANTSKPSKLAPSAETDSFYVSLHNVTGHNLGLGPTSPDFSPSSGPRGSQAIPIGEKAVWFALPSIGGYKIAFFGDGTPIKIQIIRGLDYERIEGLAQYIDVVIPAGAVAELYLSQFLGTSGSLYYDSDNNGSLDTFIDPTVDISDENA